jgi:hypothetical protein
MKLRCCQEDTFSSNSANEALTLSNLKVTSNCQRWLPRSQNGGVCAFRNEIVTSSELAAELKDFKKRRDDVNEATFNDLDFKFSCNMKAQYLSTLQIRRYSSCLNGPSRSSLDHLSLPESLQWELSAHSEILLGK